MKTNRRNFLRRAAVAGAGALSATAVSSCTRKQETPEIMPEVRKAVLAGHTQKFNMTGYGAPALAKVRIGFIGLGQRGPGAVERMTHIEGVEISALCDKYPDRVDKMQAMIAGFGLPQAKSFSGSEEAWKGICDDPE
ncbi:MAG TPA: twin-arginine translocation signal domain-containing protein, partial [Bacteroidales bacterium]|nr:twin-arginine translocation signal domain-containing protein [Bacteroidales bacterium]